MVNSKIEWTEDTWNFIYGCTHVSEGCRNCYAEKVTHRFAGEGMKFEGLTVLGANGSPRFTGKILFDEKRLLIPLKKRKPTKYFVNSMSDLFHENVSFEQIDKAFAVMALTPQHTYQILTKRPERMREYLLQLTDERLEDACAVYSHNIDDWELPLKNCWLGVSIEDQKTADERIPILLDTPAAVRWISAEPLLGNIRIKHGLAPRNDLSECSNCGYSVDLCPGEGGDHCPICNRFDTRKRIKRLDWIVAGGESGHDARPSHPDWFRQLRDQCVAAKVPFFFKQWGEWQPLPPSEDRKNSIWGEYCVESKRSKHNVYYPGFQKVGKKEAGRLLDGVEWSQYPEVKI